MTRTVTRIDPATRDACISTAATSCAPRTIILAYRRHRGDASPSTASTGSIGKGIYYGAARSEAANTHGLDVHLVGAGNSAGQAALFFAHARAQRDAARPRRRAREEHVALPGRPDRGEVQHRGPAPTPRSWRRTATRSRARSTCATAGRARPRRHESRRPVRLHRRRRRDGLAAAADRARRPRLRADRRRRAPRRRWSLDRDPYLLETSVPGVFACGDVRLEPGQARRRGGRRGQHGHRVRAPVPQRSAEAAAV